MGIEGVVDIHTEGDPGDEQKEDQERARIEREERERAREEAPAEESAPPNPGGTSGEPHRGEESV
jgi:hypothetical protein